MPRTPEPYPPGVDVPQEMVALSRDRNLAGADPRTDKLSAEWVKSRMGELRPLRVFTERQWVKRARAWKMLSVGQSYVGRSNYILPHIRNMVERVTQRVVAQLCGREDFWEALPTKPEDEDRAEVVKAVMKAQMEEEGWRRETALCVRDALILGTTIKKLCWQYEVENTMVPVYKGDQWVVGPAGPELVAQYDQTLMPRVIKNRPTGKRLNPFALFVDPGVQDFEDTDTVEVGFLSASDIFRQIELGTFNEQAALAVLSKPGEKGRPPVAQGYREVFDLSMGLRGDASNKKIAQYPYMEFWGWFPLESVSDQDLDRVKMEKVHFVILGAETVVLLERNPLLSQRKPYEKGVVIEVPGQFYGDSPVGAAIPQWMELNDCRNQSNDSRSFIVNPVMTRDPSNEDNKTSQRVFPGAVITGRNLKFESFPDVTGPAFVAEMVMVRELEETFGAPKLLDAQSDANSATEAAIEKEESGARILGYVKTLEESLVIPELRSRLDLNRQYLRTSDAVRIRGASGFDWRPYTPADFMPQYDFICVGSTAMQAKSMLNAQFAVTTDRMLAFEQLSPGTFDWVRWWGTYFRDGLGIDHPSLYIHAMKRMERVPTAEEVVLMLTEGQRPEPDPRQDFLTTLPAVGAFIATHAAIMPPDMLKNFREYFRKAVMLAQQVMLMKTQAVLQGAGEMAAGMSAQGGGKQNKEVGPEDRDGKGGSTSRQAMKSTRQGAQAA